MIRSLMTVVVVLGLATTSGCSISASSESISNSLSSPFEWSKSSSESSSGGDSGGSNAAQEVTPEPEQSSDAYSRDVTELALAFGTSGGDIDALRTAISQLAGQRGITNWEVDLLTCESIGTGMQRAGSDDQEFAAFASQLFGNDQAKVGALYAGYRGVDR